MSQRNLEKAEAYLGQTAKFSRRTSLPQYISGEPYYQVYKNFDYWLNFNNQNSLEERNVKLLLCLPLIPVRFHQQIKLHTNRNKKKAAIGLKQ